MSSWVEYFKEKQALNHLHPLPSDYLELTSSGQQEARLAVTRDHSTPTKFVEAWYLFRKLYLAPQGQGFYRGGFVESPDFHYQAVADLAQHGRNALAAPRGTAKSTVIGAEIPIFLALTRPYFPISLCLPTDKLVESRFDIIINQLTQNSLIIEDFGVQKPQRGNAIWNHHLISLNCGSKIEGFSVLGRKRGARPQLFLLDDPENDPDSDSQTSAQLVLEKFEKMLFRQIIPMLEQGSAIFWVGTLINRRSFLYRAICMDDSRFQYWNRVLLEAIKYNSGGKGKTSVLWDEKWPADVLDARRKEIGDAAFHAEYLNDPVSETERVLVIKPRRNEYTVEESVGSEISYLDDPFHSNAQVVWHSRVSETDSYEEQRQPFNDWVNSLFRITAVDYATGLNQFNDYSCIATMGFDTRNILWLLDLWQGRTVQSVLTQKIYQQARKWQVKAIGVEAVAMQVWFADAVRMYVEQQEAVWKPRVLDVKYPHGVTKADRIVGLEPRFAQGNIKYPAHLKEKYPWSHLYSQTRDFTLDLALLPFDDAIDTVSMSQYIVHARGIKAVDKTSLIPNRTQRLLRGLPLVKGMKVSVGGAEIDSITREEFEILLDRRCRNNDNEKTGFKINRPDVIG